jgi:hypothetical protein
VNAVIIARYLVCAFPLVEKWRVVRFGIVGKLKEFGTVSFDKGLSDEGAAPVLAYFVPGQPLREPATFEFRQICDPKEINRIGHQ